MDKDKEIQHIEMSIDHIEMSIDRLIALVDELGFHDTVKKVFTTAKKTNNPPPRFTIPISMQPLLKREPHFREITKRKVDALITMMHAFFPKVEIELLIGDTLYEQNHSAPDKAASEATNRKTEWTTLLGVPFNKLTPNNQTLSAQYTLDTQFVTEFAEYHPPSTKGVIVSSWAHHQSEHLTGFMGKVREKLAAIEQLPNPREILLNDEKLFSEEHLGFVKTEIERTVKEVIGYKSENTDQFKKLIHTFALTAIHHLKKQNNLSTTLCRQNAANDKLTKVKNSVFDECQKVFDASQKENPSDASQKENPSDASQKENPSDASQKENPSDASQKENPSDASQKANPSDASQKANPTKAFIGSITYLINEFIYFAELLTKGLKPDTPMHLFYACGIPCAPKYHPIYQLNFFLEHTKPSLDRSFLDGAEFRDTKKSNNDNSSTCSSQPGVPTMGKNTISEGQQPPSKPPLMPNSRRNSFSSSGISSLSSSPSQGGSFLPSTTTPPISSNASTNSAVSLQEGVVDFPKHQELENDDSQLGSVKQKRTEAYLSKIRTEELKLHLVKQALNASLTSNADKYAGALLETFLLLNQIEQTGDQKPQPIVTSTDNPTKTFVAAVVNKNSNNLENNSVSSKLKSS